MKLQQWSGSNILCGEIKYLICRPNQMWLQCGFEFDFWYLTQTPKTSILQRAAAQHYCINTNSNPQPVTTNSSSMFSCSATSMINQTRVCKGLTKKGWDVSLTSWWNIWNGEACWRSSDNWYEKRCMVPADQSTLSWQLLQPPCWTQAVTHVIPQETQHLATLANLHWGPTLSHGQKLWTSCTLPKYILAHCVLHKFKSVSWVQQYLQVQEKKRVEPNHKQKIQRVETKLPRVW